MVGRVCRIQSSAAATVMSHPAQMENTNSAGTANPAGGRIGCVAADGSNEIGGPSGLGKFQSSSPDSKMDLQRWKKHCEDEAAALQDVQHGPFRAHG